MAAVDKAGADKAAPRASASGRPAARAVATVPAATAAATAAWPTSCATRRCSRWAATAARPGGPGGPGAPNVGITVTGNVKAPGGGGGGGQFASPAQVQVDATLRRFGRTMERHVQGFMNTQRFAMPSPEITGAIAAAQQVFVQRVEARQNEGSSLAPTEMIEALREQKQALKTTANTQEERATIEVVALLFASILTEDRIPSAVRVWFARLQMPTLRVAMAEPDFFSSAQHPRAA